MNIWIASVLAAAIGYLLGSVSSAVIVSRLSGQEDIRRHGSGNAGATNMFRTYGRKAALFTTAGDIIKAVAAVLLVRTIFLFSSVPLPFDPGYLAGLFVLLGHIFPVYFGFKGGKGVMPALGIILIVSPLAFGILLAIAVPVFLMSRTVSLVSVLSAVLLPVVTLAICLIRGTDPFYETGLTLLYGALVLFSHRENIRRLLHGTEKPILPRGGKQ
ncbi:MAG: glycerol-3-phosphate 1-O-acyltransferase PlsY [Saccharofermentanales bacterium]